MSINHYSSLDLPETTLWWTQNPQQQIQIMEPIPNPSWSLHHHKNLFNLNHNEEEQELEQQNNNNEQDTTTSQEEQEGEHEHQQQEEEEEKEPMFEKPLTPSDVGKLNRLVIPKQHAEKYFPLGAAITSSTASDFGECKGLLLSFEDESGKCWRFRYSYWNSSQSYVLTKGWSRYVKDKRLDAGDIVSFERHRGDSQRLFIRWRRRSSVDVTVAQVSRAGHGGGGGDGNNGKSGGGGGVGWTSGFYRAHPSYPTHHHQQQLAYQHQQHEGLHAGEGSTSQGLNQRTRATILGNCSSSSSSSSKVLRLFGVNMECQPQHEDDDSTLPECSYNNNNNNVINHNQPPNSYSNSHMLHQQPYYY